MAVNANAINIGQIERFTVREEASEATRLARFGQLSEIPGLLFGVMTLVWIVTSLCSMA